jgi:hypothetical protein
VCYTKGRLQGGWRCADAGAVAGEDARATAVARPEKFLDVRVERRPNSRERPAKVTRIRRRNGDVTEERYEL